MRFVKIGTHYVNADAVTIVSTVNGAAYLNVGDAAFHAEGMTVEQVLAALKRGPTPCGTCRWLYLASRCSARGEAGGYVGSHIPEQVLEIGCPQHEE